MTIAGMFPLTQWARFAGALAIWLWYPNPSGLYSGTNPLVVRFDKG